MVRMTSIIFVTQINKEQLVQRDCFFGSSRLLEQYFFSSLFGSVFEDFSCSFLWFLIKIILCDRLTHGLTRLLLSSTEKPEERSHTRLQELYIICE